MEELTQEQITKSVSAAFDSVNLLNQLEAKQNPSEEETATYNRNVEHLRIMMSKDWFVAALTPEQSIQINSFIS